MNVSDYFVCEGDVFSATHGAVTVTTFKSEEPSTQKNSRDPSPLSESTMTIAIRKASNALVTAAHLYKEFAISATDLLRPSRYSNSV